MDPEATEELLDLIEQAESGLLAFEEGNSQGLHACLRALHTVKGNAHYVDAEDLGHLAHAAEDRLTEVGALPVFELLEMTAAMTAMVHCAGTHASPTCSACQTRAERWLSPTIRPPWVPERIDQPMVDAEALGGPVPLAWRPQTDRPYRVGRLVAANANQLLMEFDAALIDVAPSNQGVLLTRYCDVNVARNFHGIRIRTWVDTVAHDGESWSLVQVRCECLDTLVRSELARALMGSPAG